jgi:hypothetical protein
MQFFELFNPSKWVEYLPLELPATETVIEASDMVDHLPATQCTTASEQHEG